MFNCGMLAISLEPEVIDGLFKDFAGSDAELTIDLEAKTFTVSGNGKTVTVAFTIGDFDLDLVKAGGWVSYADARY